MLARAIAKHVSCPHGSFLDCLNLHLDSQTVFPLWAHMQADRVWKPVENIHARLALCEKKKILQSLQVKVRTDTHFRGALNGRYKYSIFI